MEVKGILITVLLFALVSIGGAYLLGQFAGETVSVPGQSAGEELEARTDDYLDKMKSVSEGPTGLIEGFLGVAGLIKMVLIDTPIYAGVVVVDVVGHFGLPSAFAGFLIAILTIVVVYEGILLLRGVK